MMNIGVNPAVEALQPYVPGEQPRDPAVIKLNTNESPYPAAPQVREAVRRAADDAAFNKYPDPWSTRLRAALAKRAGVTTDEVLPGNGSDEVLRLICHAFLRPGTGDRIGMLDPTYVLYETLAAMFGCGTQRFAVSAPDYAIPPAAIEADVKVLFIASPNPPYGTYYTPEALDEVAAARPERLVVIDEAYADFAGGSALEVYRRRENVILTRTFSKSMSLAGLRVGYALAHGPLFAQLAKIKDSYNLDQLCQTAAEAALSSEAENYYAARNAEICANRDWLAGELRKRGFDVPVSRGNFVFARRPGAKALYEALKARKILVRYFAVPLLDDGVRITIGTREQLNALLAAIDETG
ncbi:MAG: histidinol-phosphate transaminase [Candidatus Sumerlaeaceae bacterium]|nr:histidinol-phosphate transaminase [Candidatus Sumerlaeaceae bacterium]